MVSKSFLQANRTGSPCYSFVNQHKTIRAPRPSVAVVFLNIDGIFQTKILQ